MPVADDALVELADPASPAAEAYRALRASVQFASVDRSLRSLLVTSAVPEDDKSLVAANLAVAFARAGSRVVLVDCDVRQPSLHDIFGADNSRGLSAALLGDEQAPPLLETGVANLRLLPAGERPSHPADFLGSQRMQSLLERLLASADLVVCDGPPVLAAVDAALLARRVDGVVLVIRSGRTKRDQAAKARALLAKAQANLLGAVLTNAKLEKGVQGYFA